MVYPSKTRGCAMYLVVKRKVGRKIRTLGFLSSVLALAAACADQCESCARLRNQAAALREQVRELQEEEAELRARVDEFEHGPARLLASAEAWAAAGELEAAREQLEDLLVRHPESAESQDGRALLADVDRQLAAIKEELEKERALKAEKEKRDFERATGRLTSELDEFTGITWLRHPAVPKIKTSVAAYFGTRDGSAADFPLRFSFHYWSERSLFVESLSIKVDDENFRLNDLDFSREVVRTKVWEWTDEPVRDYEMLAAMLSAKKVTIRIHGATFHEDFVVPEGQLRAMREVRTAWLGLGGQPGAK